MQHGEMAKRIVEVANNLMVERGYSAFSYADVSTEIGISKATIHHHFPAKSDLAVAVLKRHRERLEQSTQYLETEMQDPLAVLRAYVRYWEACIKDRSVSFCVAALLSAEMPVLPEEVRTEVRRHFEFLSGWLERMLSAGVKSNVFKLEANPADEAQLFMAAVHGGMLSARASGSCDVFPIVTKSALSRISVVKQ